MKWLERLEWRVIFRPTAAIRSTPAAYDVDYESVSFPTDDGETLHGWFLPAPTSEADTPGTTATAATSEPRRTTWRGCTAVCR